MGIVLISYAKEGRKKKRRYKAWYDVLEEAVQDSRYTKELEF